MSVSYRSIPREEFVHALELITATVRPGGIYIAEVGHDDECPCRGDRAPMAKCTCAAVDLTVAELQ